MPRPPSFVPDAVTQEVLALVEARFGDHFGDLSPFGFAVTRVDAEAAFEAFVEQGLPKFGDFQDAMLTGEPFLYHAVIAQYLNCGLLDPLARAGADMQRHLAGFDLREVVLPDEGEDSEALEALLPREAPAAYVQRVTALKLDAAHLSDELTRGLSLAEKAAIAENLRRRADENRLEAESDVYRALLKINRFVQNAEDTGLEQEFAKLAEWIASTHTGGRAAAPAPAPAAVAPKNP